MLLASVVVAAAVEAAWAGEWIVPGYGQFNDTVAAQWLLPEYGQVHDSAPAILVGAPSAFAYSATGTPTVTLPAHNEGDLLVLFTYHREDSPVPTCSVSGWTKVGSEVFIDLGAVGLSLAVFYKIAGASEGNPTATWDGSFSSGAMVQVYQNVDSAVVDQVAIDTGTDANTTSQTSTVQTQTDGAWIIMAAALDDDVTISAGTGGGTVDGQGGTATGSDAQIAIAHELIATAGADGFQLTCVAVEAWAYLAFAIKPTGAAEVPPAAPTRMTLLGIGP
jgi:hypothetical protein